MTLGSPFALHFASAVNDYQIISVKEEIFWSGLFQQVNKGLLPIVMEVKYKTGVPVSK